MNLSLVLLLVVVLAALLYSLFKILGKNVGYGSSDSEKEMLRNASRAMKSRQDSSLEGMPKSANSLGIEGARRPAIIRISELKIDKQDSLILNQIDQNDHGINHQDVVDGFYLFGQSLIEKELVAKESKETQEEATQIMPKSTFIDARDNEQSPAKVWSDYFNYIRTLNQDVDFLVYKLMGISNVKLSQDHILSFLAETLCSFNLYNKAKSGYSRLNKQLRYLFKWTVSVDLKSWPNPQWQISDLNIELA